MYGGNSDNTKTDIIKLSRGMRVFIRKGEVQILLTKIQKSTHPQIIVFFRKVPPCYPSDIVGPLGYGFNDWKFVRHVPQGSNWHPATDQLRCVHNNFKATKQ